MASDETHVSDDSPVNGVSPCAHCRSTEPPDNAGLCPNPACRKFRPGHTVNVKHFGRAKLTPQDLATRDALVARLLAERGGRDALDIVAQLRIEDYATAQVQLGKVTRKLEEVGAVSVNGNKRTSLVDTYTAFSARVERLAQELPPVVARTVAADNLDLSGVPTPEFLARARANLERLEALVGASPQAVAGTTASDPHVGARNPPHLTETTGDPTRAASDATSPVSEPPSAVVEPPTCQYCHRTLDVCAELKLTRLYDWRLLHGNHPEEVERRTAEAQAVMARTMSHGSGITKW